jgi:hypothetical protein
MDRPSFPTADGDKQVAEVFVILDNAYDNAYYFFYVQKITPDIHQED